MYTKHSFFLVAVFGLLSLAGGCCSVSQNLPTQDTWNPHPVRDAAHSLSIAVRRVPHSVVVDSTLENRCRKKLKMILSLSGGFAPISIEGNSDDADYFLDLVVYENYAKNAGSAGMLSWDYLLCFASLYVYPSVLSRYDCEYVMLLHTQQGTFSSMSLHRRERKWGVIALIGWPLNLFNPSVDDDRILSSMLVDIQRQGGFDGIFIPTPRPINPKQPSMP